MTFNQRFQRFKLKLPKTRLLTKFNRYLLQNKLLLKSFITNFVTAAKALKRFWNV